MATNCTLWTLCCALALAAAMAGRGAASSSTTQFCPATILFGTVCSAAACATNYQFCLYSPMVHTNWYSSSTMAAFFIVLFDAITDSYYSVSCDWPGIRECVTTALAPWNSPNLYTWSASYGAGYNDYGCVSASSTYSSAGNCLACATGYALITNYLPNICGKCAFVAVGSNSAAQLAFPWFNVAAAAGAQCLSCSVLTVVRRRAARRLPAPSRR